MTEDKINYLSNAEADSLEQQICWILGSGRSGSTWLGTQLLKTNETLIWDEPYVGASFPMVEQWQKNRGSNYFFSPKSQKSWKPLLKKLILNRVFYEFQTIDKKIIVKEPNSGQGMGIILSSLPNSKFLFLLRDGRDVVDSQIDAHSKGSWNEDGVNWVKNQNREKRIELFSKGWTKSIESVYNSFQKHDSNKKLLVKYEDLLQNTLSELKRIYEFLHIEMSDDRLKKITEKYAFKNIPSEKKGQGKFFRKATQGEYQETFSDKEQDLMISIMGKTLEKLDYNI